MPDIQVLFRPGSHVTVTQQRELLAEALVKQLPAMIVKALGAIGTVLTERQMVVNIVQYHQAAYNVPDLAVLVTLEPGDDDIVYGCRERVRQQLAEDVLRWLVDSCEAYPYATKDLCELDVLLRFAYTAGVSYDVASGMKRSHWG